MDSVEKEKMGRARTKILQNQGLKKKMLSVCLNVESRGDHSNTPPRWIDWGMDGLFFLMAVIKKGRGTALWCFCWC